MVNIQKLATEISKPEYVGKTNAEILALLPKGENKVGRIQGDDKLDLVTLIITEEIDERLVNAQSMTNDQLLALEPPVAEGYHDAYRGLAKKLSKALNVDLLMKDVYRINLAVPEVKAAFDGAVQFGLIKEIENTKITNLATYRINDDFDAVDESHIEKAKLVGEQTSAKTNYPGGHFCHIRNRNKNVRIFVVADAPVLEDTEVIVPIWSCPDGLDNTKEENFSPTGRVLTQIILKGKTSAEIVHSLPSARNLRYEAITNRLIGHYELYVQDA